MASRSFAEEDLSCPVCCDIFINPVLLSCSHSFCSSCIQRVWENKTLKECPVCRKTSSNDHPPVNLALRNLCESFQQEKRDKSGSGFCSVHNEKLKLFCLDDQQPVCVVCRDSRKHTDHRFCPVDEAVADKKEILKASLERLQEELITSVNREQNLCKTAEDIKFDAQCIETQIKEEFEELHQFLHDEEASRITALTEEEEKRSQMMKKKIEETSKQISSLTITIRDIEEQMKAEDASFLQNFEVTLQRAQYIPGPDLSPSVTVTFTGHLTNLKLSVLQKIQDNVGETSDFNIESKQEKEIRPAFDSRWEKQEKEKGSTPAFSSRWGNQEKGSTPAFGSRWGNQEKGSTPAFGSRWGNQEKGSTPAFGSRWGNQEKGSTPAFGSRWGNQEKGSTPAFGSRWGNQEKGSTPAFGSRWGNQEKGSTPAFGSRWGNQEKGSTPAFGSRWGNQEKGSTPAFGSRSGNQEKGSTPAFGSRSGNQEKEMKLDQ